MAEESAEIENELNTQCKAQTESQNIAWWWNYLKGVKFCGAS